MSTTQETADSASTSRAATASPHVTASHQAHLDSLTIYRNVDAALDLVIAAIIPDGQYPSQLDLAESYQARLKASIKCLSEVVTDRFGLPIVGGDGAAHATTQPSTQVRMQTTIGRTDGVLEDTEAMYKGY